MKMEPCLVVGKYVIIGCFSLGLLSIYKLEIMPSLDPRCTYDNSALLLMGVLLCTSSCLQNTKQCLNLKNDGYKGLDCFEPPLSPLKEASIPLYCRAVVSVYVYVKFSVQRNHCLFDSSVLRVNI